MGAKPVVAEDEVCVTIHVELHKDSLLIQPPEDQLGRHRAAGRPRGAIRLPNGLRVARRRRPAACGGELRRQGAAQEAVGGPRIQQTLDSAPPRRRHQPAVDPRQRRTRHCVGPRASKAGGEGLKLLGQGARRGAILQRGRDGCWARGRVHVGRGRADSHGSDGGGEEEEAGVDGGRGTAGRGGADGGRGRDGGGLAGRARAWGGTAGRGARGSRGGRERWRGRADGGWGVSGVEGAGKGVGMEGNPACKAVWGGVGGHRGRGVTPRAPGRPKESGVAVDTARRDARDGVVVGTGAVRLGRAGRAAKTQPEAAPAAGLGLVGRPVAGVAVDRVGALCRRCRGGGRRRREGRGVRV